MTIAGLLALLAPLGGVLMKLLARWLWKKATKDSVTPVLEDELNENAKVVAGGSDAELNRVLDDRLRN